MVGKDPPVSAREEILARIRRATAGAPEPQAVPVPGPAAVADPVVLFCERVAGYRATVRRVAADGLSAAVAEALREGGVRRLVVPADLPAGWLAAGDGVTVLRDDPPLAVDELDATDGVLTGSAVGIAVTGTIALDAGPAQGRRVLTLVPDYHLCVVRAADVVDDVPTALARLDPGRPLTLISGPSATSDIELDRVEGVHGPRTLVVLVVG